LRGEIIGEYLGKQGPHSYKEWKTMAYILDGIDAEKYGNEIGRINDGFPNIVGVPVSSGLRPSLRYIFIAAEPIKEGSEFCWDYGAKQSTKFGPYQELRPQALRNWIKEQDVSSLPDLLKRTRWKVVATGEASFDEYFLFKKLCYLLAPSVFFSLILEGVIDKKTAYALSHLRYMASATLPEGFEDLVSIASALREHPESVQEIKELIASKGIRQALQRGRKIINGSPPPCVT
jgi:hypothetical protein